MDIEIAKGSGFCFGVRRAVNLAMHAAAGMDGRIVTFGPLVHNPLVVEMLEAKGIRAVEEVSGDADVVIIRAHGIPVPHLESLRRQQVEIIDATCPFVKRSQRYAKALRDEGYQVVILGDREHPEVRAVGSYAGGQAVVVESPDDLPDAFGPRVGVLAQTTQSEEAFLRLVHRIVLKAKVVKVINTICRSTAARLADTERLARTVQIMIVVGGRKSHNTLELVRVCRLTGIETYHVERVEELQVSWFRNRLHVGISAGASTPDWAIDGVAEAVHAIGKPARGDGVEIRQMT
jgi:(E)-4-hydroxy-3-methyl-but-2-enyl pyrophosphate reductase